jgi:hypothetical protein
MLIDVELEREPEVAVTFTVPDSGVDVLPPPEFEDPPLQAVTQVRLSVAAMHRIQSEYQRRFLNRMKHSENASAATGMYRSGDGGRLLALVLAEIVSIVEATAPDGVTVAGEKLHVVPAGKPEQLNDTDELNPFTGVIEIVLVPLCPGAIVSDAAEAVIEKPGTV